MSDELLEEVIREIRSKIIGVYDLTDKRISANWINGELVIYRY